MTRRCPVTNELVLYLDCMECELKELCKDLAEHLDSKKEPEEG